MSQSTLNEPNNLPETATTAAGKKGRAPSGDHSAGRGRVTALDRGLLKILLHLLGNPPIDVRLWDGVPQGTATNEGGSRVDIRDRHALWKLFYDPSLGFGEGYSDGRIEIHGDLVSLCETVDESMLDHKPRPSLLRRLQAKIRYRGNTLARSKANIHRHYDIGNEFYSMWLDEQMVYTCAYFDDPELSLEAAQAAKMDHVCRKVRLKPGNTVVEAGCGWGALALHMAREYGAKVKAYNISHEQVVYARQRAEREGLSQQVEFIEEDWRKVAGEFDAFVSVGMLEHVGPENYRELGQVVSRSLKPHGLGLVHTIGRNYEAPLDAWTSKRIFPGAYPPSLRQMTDLFENSRLSILDVENLRMHYAKTLKHWLERYEEHAESVREMFDDKFVRMWRLYLASSVAAFLAGSLQLFQVTFAHARNNEIPMTREHLYQCAH